MGMVGESLRVMLDVLETISVLFVSALLGVLGLLLGVGTLVELVKKSESVPETPGLRVAVGGGDAVEAETAGGKVVLYRPYGEPTENYLIPLAILAGAVGLTSYVIAKKVICR